MKRYLRRKEVAWVLGVAELTLYKWVREGKVKFIKSPGGEYTESGIYSSLFKSLGTKPYGRVSLAKNVQYKRHLCPALQGNPHMPSKQLP